MSSQEYAVLAERLHDASPEERFELFRQAAKDDTSRSRLHEAFVLLSAARGSREDREDREDDEPLPRDSDEIALDLSRGQVFPDALADWESVEWLLDSLAPPEEGGTDKSSTATRRAARAVIRPRPVHRRWLFWVPAFGVTTAAGLLAVLLLSPATTPWAESIELTRLGQWRLNGEFRTDVQRALGEGQLSESLFELPEASSRQERAAINLGADPARPIFPRWEATAEAMPTFEWEGEIGASEVVLLNARRKMVWSVDVTDSTRLDYPTDQQALELGETYYWKVNRQVGERLLASPYVGFRVMDTTERKALYIDLRASGAHPFLAGCAYDRHGLYTAAANAFERSAQRERQRAPALAALAAVRAKQGLTE